MYRVLLVDDDLIVRQFLKETLHWENVGFQVVGDVSDGIAALNQYEHLNPDLILTDMNMPHMDGLELIRRLRAGGYDGAIVVLSCHDDFELVKGALQGGADEYLRKSQINQIQTDQMLNQLRKLVEERKKTAVNRRRLQELAREGQKSRQRGVIQQLLAGGFAVNELPDLLCAAGLKAGYHRCTLLLFQPLGADPEQLDALFELFISREDENEFLEISSAIGAMILDLSDTPSAREWEERTRELCMSLGSTVSQHLALPLVLAVSEVCEGEIALVQALRQAYHALQNGFYEPGVYRFGENKMSESIPIAASTFQKELEDLLTEGDPTSLEMAYQNVMNTFFAERTHPEKVLEWLHGCDQIAGVTRKESFYDSLKRFSQYQSCVQEYLTQQVERQRERIPDTAGPAVRTAVRYIRSHYQESIGLGHAARAAGLTPTYLSALFKKEMGIGLAEYLLHTRLEHVKRGLQNSTATVKELSEQAGFPDYQHFCKTFRKKVGVGPREYRRQQKSK